MLLETILFASIPENDNCNLIMKLRTLILALFIIAFDDYHILIYFLLLGIFSGALNVDETDVQKNDIAKADLADQAHRTSNPKDIRRSV